MSNSYLFEPDAEPWRFPEPRRRERGYLGQLVEEVRNSPWLYPSEDAPLGAVADPKSTPHERAAARTVLAARPPLGRTEEQEASQYDPRWGAAEIALNALPVSGRAAKLGAATLGGLVAMTDDAQAGAIKKLTELGLYPTSTARRVYDKTLKGGYSVNLPSGEIPTEGLMMGKYRNTDPRNFVIPSEEFKRADIERFAAKNMGDLARQDMYLGTWLNQPENKVYLDVAQRFSPEQIRQATKFGERTGQLAGYNVGADESFPVGNWRGFVAGPEFRGRMGEMSDVGRKYLDQFPTKEWWDMHHTPFERVYGTEKLPQVAGFSAATAPSTKPAENMQMMSEYMRRHLKGEPIVQPEFRLPEDVMGPRRPGMQMSMERGRVANLEKANRGDLDALQRAKVREEAKAMMGDPNAVVLDRHFARLTEAPERGIFANAQEGVIDTNPRVRAMGDYDFVKQHVSDAARSVGRNPRDYSADVWTGIRETIKNTNQLYGTPFKGSAITGESKSYADVFQDLVAKKARHLGITEAQLDARLRRGDADLLSTMLISSPVLYGAYQQWSGGAAAPKEGGFD